MKKFFILAIFLLSTINVFAEDNTMSESWILNNSTTSEIDYTIDLEKEIENKIDYEVSINTEYDINLEEIENKLKILYPDKKFRAIWNIVWVSPQEWFKFSRNFREKWEKEIEFIIYQTSELKDENNNTYLEEKILYSKKFKVLVFEKIIPLIISSWIKEEDLNSYIEFSKNDWTYIYEIWPLSKTDIELANIMSNYEDYLKISWLKTDYLTIWWDRDFIFDILSKIQRELTTSNDTKTSLNIVSISPYNINILQSYLKNFLANKTWAKKIILLNESSKFSVLKESSIDNLISELWKNELQYVDVNLWNKWINKIFFISEFINNLSNLWYSTDWIYIFLIIPLLFTIISFFKHFIWLSPIWIVIPTFLTVLFFKLWFIITLVLLIFFLVVNFLISIITNRYNLLYIPKISFVISINIILFIVLVNIGYSFNLISLDLNSTLYFIMFIIISERFINIILSKDLAEYKDSFFYTLLIPILCFAILNINSVKIFVLAYPELLITLVPINFIIWRFTWLRVTEYLRFREVIKNIEE